LQPAGFLSPGRLHNGGDALIINRAGTNTLVGGSGTDLIGLKESAGLVNSDGSFNFGQQVISGGGRTRCVSKAMAPRSAKR
jgi:hypothetical protein